MKSKNQYSSLAEYYDALNSHVDYEAYADFIDRTLARYGTEKGALLLDLACGTGNITIPLAKRGYDMTGIDISPEMLDVARDKAFDEEISNILWLKQDMTDFELYGTVAAIVCCLDGINYLTRESDLQRCFELANNYLDPAGIFMFDVNSPYKFEHVYAQNDYILEADGVFCGWSNFYDQSKETCTFELSIFAETQDGSYVRYDETQTERMWRPGKLKSMLKKADFDILEIVADFKNKAPQRSDERLYFVCRKSKKSKYNNG